MGATAPANSFVSTTTVQDYARLLRDQQQLQQAMNDALDQASKILGVQL